MPAGMAALVEVVVLANFTKLPDNMRTVTLHQILARDKYPGETREPHHAHPICRRGGLRDRHLAVGMQQVIDQASLEVAVVRRAHSLDLITGVSQGCAHHFRVSSLHDLRRECACG